MISGSSTAVPLPVWRGTGLQIAGRVWSAVCGLWALRLAATALDPAAFGRFTFYLSLFAVLDTFVALGTGEVAIQRTAHDPGAVPGVLLAARRIRVATGILGALIVAGLSFGFGESGAPWIVLAACYPITHSLELSTLVWRNRIAWGKQVAIRAVAATLSLGGVAWLANTANPEPALYLVAIALGSALGNFLLHFAARSQLPIAPAGLEPARGIFNAAWPLGLSALCAQSYFYIDNVFVRAMAGDVELGRYNVAVKLMGFLLLVAQYATLSALPWLTRCAAENRLESAIARFGPRLFAAAGLLCGCLWPWTELILERLVPGTAAAGGSLRWLLLAALAIHAGSVLLTAVVATSDNRSKLAIQVGGLVLNVAMNVWAIPRYGIEGAGMATFATESFVAIGAAIALARRGVIPFRGRAALAWCAGPALFLLSKWISGLLPLH